VLDDGRKPKKPARRRWRRVALGILVVLGLVLLAVVVDGWRAFGKRAGGARRARMERSPQWQSGHFVDPQPMHNDFWGALRGALHASPYTSPTAALPVVPVDPKELESPPPSGLRVTWLGHSTLLIEIDGHRILTDPTWSDRASPFGWTGPRRWFAPPIALSALPHLDAVVISHDHYDHLDYRTVVALRDRDTTFVVPLGIGAHLAYWGVPESRIVELDWWEHTTIGDLAIVCSPARHASGRALVDDDAKLWAGWAFLGPTHRTYYSGDTGFFPGLRDIGDRLGPFDVTMIEIGQYGRAWPDWHLGPEQAVAAHQMLRGRVMLPVHWATFALAYHGWTEPIERALVAAHDAGVTLVAPKPGESFEPSAPPPIQRWWPDLPWKTAAEDPIVATQRN
jgi:L-ascorbate metabolism protein UlaG (beta-lactamase superfamily)